MIDDCNEAFCSICKDVEDDPIIDHLVATQDDAWEVIHKAFNLGDNLKAKIEENSEDDHIRCMDIIHRIRHHDSDLTWEFVEIQVRREDAQLADVIRKYMYRYIANA